MRKLTGELLDTRVFIFHVDALDIALHFSDEELGDGALSWSSLGCQYFRRFTFDRHKDFVCTFIMDSNLSWRMRLNSWTSRRMNISEDFHPKDLDSSFVPERKGISHENPEGRGRQPTNRLV